jgi:ABC-2 type transport system ATP-binding protein
MKRGKLLAAGPVNEVLANEDIVELSSLNAPHLKSVLENFPGHSSIQENGELVQLHFPIGTAPMEEINRYCFDKGIVLNKLLLKKKSLETKFFELTND